MRSNVSALIVVALGASGIAFAAPAVAAGSSFSGVVYPPERGSNEVVIRGDLTFDPGDCPESIGDFELANAEVQTPAYGILPGPGSELVGDEYSWNWYWRTNGQGQYRPPGTQYVDIRYGSLTPGEYRFVVAALYQRVAGNTTKWVTCKVLDPTPIVAVAKTSEALATIASKTSVSVGESVTLSVETVAAWSDGVTTREPVRSGSFTLQQRAPGSLEWETLSTGPPTAIVRPTVPTEYRFLRDRALSTPVVVDVIVPTSARRISQLALTPATAMVGSLMTATAVIETQFTDQSWKPAPAGTTFDVQHYFAASNRWVTRASGVVSVAGRAQVQFQLLDGGTYRIASGDAVSESASVTVVEPVSVVSVGGVALPSTVRRGTTLNVSVSVQSEFSDGVVRPTPAGTPFMIEFAVSPKRVPGGGKNSALVWRSARADVIRQAGTATASARVAKSGYWRVRFAPTVMSDAAFVRVRR